MARYSIDGQVLTDIADAIRNKTIMTETKTTMATQFVFKSPNATAPGEYATITEEHADFFKDGYESYLYRIPGASKMRVTYDFNLSFANSFWIEPHDEKGVIKDYNSNIISTNQIVNGVAEYDGDVLAVSFRNRDLSYISGNMGLYVTFIGLDADGKPIALEGDENLVEVEYVGLHDMTPAEMAEEIASILPGPNVDELTITGSCNSRFIHNGWNWFINKYGNKITTKNINNCGNMFSNSDKLVSIPFDINLDSSQNFSLARMFDSCYGLTAMPNIFGASPTDLQNFAYYCTALKSFPEGFAEDWKWTYLESLTSSYSGNMSNMFRNCYALHNVPTALISHTNPVISNSSCIYCNSFQNNYNIEEINGLAVPYNASWSSNAFKETFNGCNRLKNISFKTQEDGTPYAAPGWKNQVIDLTTVGYGQNCATYNSSLTMDTFVNSVEQWEAAINGTNPDYWTSTSGEYTFYDRRALVRTLHTLPDVSGSNSTNTIKLRKSVSGINDIGSGLGDEGTISKLSDAEIAIAAAKGWTVTLI